MRHYRAPLVSALVVLFAARPASACMNEMVATPNGSTVLLMVGAVTLAAHLVSLRFVEERTPRVVSLFGVGVFIAFMQAALRSNVGAADDGSTALVYGSFILVILAHRFAPSAAPASPSTMSLSAGDVEVAAAPADAAAPAAQAEGEVKAPDAQHPEDLDQAAE